MSGRIWQQRVFNFEAGATLSDMRSLGGGAFGTILVPAALAGKTLQFITDFSSDDSFARGINDPDAFDGVELLSEPITLVEGANALSADQIRELGASGPVKLKLNSSIGAASQIVVWWKD